jgi:undecaprenyl diphosphate synthase
MKTSALPKHVAFIMDGNRRWARKQGMPQLEGHRRGLERTKEMVDECLKLGVQVCSLWCFSTENWQRSQKEVSYLMRLFEEYLKEHVQELHAKGIKLVHVGRKDRLPKKVSTLFKEAEQLTVNNSQLTVNLCIDYGGRDEILRAIKRACQEGKSHWTEEDFSLLLDTTGTADPDLIIRTSGEQRTSGFMLWQGAYSELYFTDTCFPDFAVDEFHKALQEYDLRNRTKGA